MMAFVSACQGHSARTVTVSSQTNAVYAGRIWIIVNSEVPPILFAFSEHLERNADWSQTHQADGLQGAALHQLESLRQSTKFDHKINSVLYVCLLIMSPAVTAALIQHLYLLIQPLFFIYSSLFIIINLFFIILINLMIIGEKCFPLCRFCLR